MEKGASEAAALREKHTALREKHAALREERDSVAAQAARAGRVRPSTNALSRGHGLAQTCVLSVELTAQRLRRPRMRRGSLLVRGSPVD